MFRAIDETHGARHIAIMQGMQGHILVATGISGHSEATANNDMQGMIGRSFLDQYVIFAQVCNADNARKRLDFIRFGFRANLFSGFWWQSFARDFGNG